MNRPVLLFKSKSPHPSEGGHWFTDDPGMIDFPAAGPVCGIRLTGAEATRLHPVHGRYRIPDRIAARAESISDVEVERHGTMRQLYADARHMRRSLGLDPIECSIPGEMAPIARMLFRHIPEAAARVGVPIGTGEGGSDMQQFAVDLRRAAPVAEILSRQPDTAGMTFAVHPTAATRIMLEMAEQDARPARVASFAATRQIG